jgi:hypothetical protein
MWSLWWAQFHWNEFSLRISDSLDDYVFSNSSLFINRPIVDAIWSRHWELLETTNLQRKEQKKETDLFVISTLVIPMKMAAVPRRDMFCYSELQCLHKMSSEYLGDIFNRHPVARMTNIYYYYLQGVYPVAFAYTFLLLSVKTQQLSKSHSRRLWKMRLWVV